MITFIGSPIPSHRISSGISARLGMARLTCTGPSITASPTRLSPETSASASPTPTPITSPSEAR